MYYRTCVREIDFSLLSKEKRIAKRTKQQTAEFDVWSFSLLSRKIHAISTVCEGIDHALRDNRTKNIKGTLSNTINISKHIIFATCEYGSLVRSKEGNTNMDK